MSKHYLLALLISGSLITFSAHGQTGGSEKSKKKVAATTTKSNHSTVKKTGEKKSVNKTSPRAPIASTQKKKTNTTAANKSAAGKKASGKSVTRNPSSNKTNTKPKDPKPGADKASAGKPPTANVSHAKGSTGKSVLTKRSTTKTSPDKTSSTAKSTTGKTTTKNPTANTSSAKVTTAQTSTAKATTGKTTSKKSTDNGSTDKTVTGNPATTITGTGNASTANVIVPESSVDKTTTTQNSTSRVSGQNTPGVQSSSDKQQVGSARQSAGSQAAIQPQPQTTSDNMPASSRTLTSSQNLHPDTSATATAVNLLRVKQAVVSIARDPAPPYAPNAIAVTDQTIRLGAGQKEELMFSFTAGEKIIFSFEEADGKELNEFEVIEQPAQSRFSAYKSTQITNKEIVVQQEAIYVFRMRNTSLSKRICKLRIQRVPAPVSAQKFESAVSGVIR